MSGQDRVAGKVFLTKHYLAFRESRSERPEMRVQLLIPLSQIVSIQRARGIAGTFYLTRDLTEPIDALAIYDKEGLVHSFIEFASVSELEEFYGLLDAQWRPLLETTPAAILEECRDIPDGQNVPLQRCSSIFEPPPSDPRVPSVFAQRSEGEFKPRLLPMTRDPIRVREESESFRQREIAAAELYQKKAHPRLSSEVRQSIESFDKRSMHHVIQPSAARSYSLSSDRPVQPQPLRPRAESLPETVLRDIRYYGMYRTLKHISPMRERAASPLHQLDLPEYRKYSAPADLRREVEHFETDRLHHLDPPQPKPLEQLLALNEYEPKPPKLLEAIRSFGATGKLHHQRNAAERPAKFFAQWQQLLRQIEPFSRSRLRHVLPDRRPCYPLFLDATDGDEWWQKTFFAGRCRLERFVLHAKSSSESRFAIIGDGVSQEIKVAKPTVRLEKEVRVPLRKERGISATIATETQNAAGLA